MFQVNEFVVYGNIGVCRVETIGPAPLPELNQEREYYTLMPVYGTVKIYAPTDTTVTMRPVIEPGEVERLVDIFPRLKAPIISTSNSTELASEYRKLMGNHDCESLLILLKSIHKKIKKAEKEGRRTGLTDARFLKQAEDLLYGEFSISLNIDRERIEERFDDLLRQMDEGKMPESEEEGKPKKSTKSKTKSKTGKAKKNSKKKEDDLLPDEVLSLEETAEDNFGLDDL